MKISLIFLSFFVFSAGTMKADNGCCGCYYQNCLNNNKWENAQAFCLTQWDQGCCQGKDLHASCKQFGACGEQPDPCSHDQSKSYRTKHY